MRMAVIKIYQRIKLCTEGAFCSRLLFLTNLGISVASSAVGDGIEQYIEIRSDKTQQYEGIRTAHMAVTGLTVGVVCHHWYRFLDNRLPGRTIGIVLKKVLLDQLIGSPLCLTMFFATLGIVERHSYHSIKNEIQGKALKLYAADWVVWPAAQVINFSILPTQYRVLYDNIISLGYDIYTSRIKYSSSDNK